ncbi:tape measure protein [Vibrio quintilis]|uniref:Tape measure protein N-terminal domain-containing protein n=1 Tax=Vibrio quintilis TaxID=1117707 RepID=A0A1M7Z1P7_9VIBR|nr:tape measure protein [Vibrio quintilis]SHO58801.1 hypothetical protein VQ7734_04573 [Vibrio quintilis]
MNRNDLKFTLRFNAENKEFIGQVRAAAGSVDSLGTHSTATGRKLNTLAKETQTAGAGFGSLKGQLTGLIGGFSALAAAISAKDRLGEYQDIRTRITALVGGQQQWIETEQYLNRVADEHHKTLSGLSNSYARLLTLENGGLITHQQTIDIFEGMSNAASANGASSEQLGQVMYGLQQAMASGTVRAEEFNQVTEPMPDLLIKLAKAAHTSVGGLRNMVNSGKMTSKLFGTTLVKALSAYDGAAARTADNISAQSAAFEQSYLKMVTAYETPISSVFSDSIAASTSVMDSLADHVETVSSVIGVTLAAAAGRGVAALTTLTAEKIKSVAASRQQLQATVAETQAELTATQAEIRHLETMQLSNNQKFRAIGAETSLAAAQARRKVLTDTLTASQTRLNLVMRAGSGVMSALGGPVGVAMMAASALSYFAMSARSAKTDTGDLEERVDLLLGRMDKLKDKELSSAIDAQTSKVAELRREYQKIAYAPAPERSLWQKMTETNSEMRARQIRESKEAANAVYDVAGKLSKAESSLTALQNKLQELRETKSVTPKTTHDDGTDTQKKADAAKKLLANLQKQVALYGQTSQVAKVRYETEHGSLKGINDQLKQQLLLQAQLLDKKAKKKKAKTDKIDDFYESSDKLNNEYMKRLAIQADYQNKAQTEEEYAYTSRQELLQQKFDAAYAQATGHQEQMHALEREYFQNRQILRQEHEMNLTEITRKAEEERQALQFRSTVMILGSGSQMFSGLAGLAKAYSGEQSGIYRTMFAASKGFAVAQASMNLWQAISNASAVQPWYASLPAIAQATTQGATVLASLKSVNYAGQAHDGIDRVPASNEGTWMLKANEMVLNPSQADNFRWMTEMMQQMRSAVSSASSGNTAASASSGGVIVNIHTQSGETATTQKSQTASGDTQLDIYIQKAVNASMNAMYQDADNGGPVSTRIRANAS